jgi:hypothetical protein
VGRTLLRRSGIPGAWLRCSITGADGNGDDEASLSVGEEEVEGEAAWMLLSAGILETLAMADRGLGLEAERTRTVRSYTTIMLQYTATKGHGRDE